jgi:hypothetical protein
VVYRRLEPEPAPVEMTIAWRREGGSAPLAAFVATATSRRYDVPAPPLAAAAGSSGGASLDDGVRPG